MPEFGKIESMRIEKAPRKPKTKPPQVALRFHGEREEALFALIDKTARKADLPRETFIKKVMETALRDPKFVLKVGE